jgi:hypothetical protein
LAPAGDQPGDQCAYQYARSHAHTSYPKRVSNLRCGASRSVPDRTEKPGLPPPAIMATPTLPITIFISDLLIVALIKSMTRTMREFPIAFPGKDH